MSGSLPDQPDPYKDRVSALLPHLQGNPDYDVAYTAELKVRQIRGPGADEQRVAILTKELSAGAFAIYCEIRRARDEVLARQIEAHPEYVPDLLQRLRTLSRLRYMTPRYEVDASVMHSVVQQKQGVATTEGVAALLDGQTGTVDMGLPLDGRQREFGEQVAQSGRLQGLLAPGGGGREL
jgi:hypothetical protein